jgi:hypothetical protein
MAAKTKMRTIFFTANLLCAEVHKEIVVKKRALAAFGG